MRLVLVVVFVVFVVFVVIVVFVVLVELVVLVLLGTVIFNDAYICINPAEAYLIMVPFGSEKNCQNINPVFH